jgi:RNA recognition motif-containing protein
VSLIINPSWKITTLWLFHCLTSTCHEYNLTVPCNSETTSIPVNPRTNRPVGYAFVDLETAEEADKAINELSGKEILERKVSVQLARKPEPAGEKTEAPVSGGEGASGGEGRKRGSGRGRGRGRGRGGRGRGGARGVCCLQTSFFP